MEKRTKDKPWKLKTPPNTSEYTMHVEEKDASLEEKKIQEINTGCFAFDCQSLFAALDQVQPNNSQGEYYLTDVAEILRTSGKPVVAARRLTIEEALGVNTPEQLAEVEQVMQSRREKT